MEQLASGSSAWLAIWLDAESHMLLIVSDRNGNERTLEPYSEVKLETTAETTVVLSEILQGKVRKSVCFDIPAGTIEVFAKWKKWKTLFQPHCDVRLSPDCDAVEISLSVH
jgi:hypothetical protein